MTRISREFGNIMQKDIWHSVSVDVSFVSNKFPNYKIGANDRILEPKEGPEIPSMKEIVARETAQLLEQQKRLSVRDLANKFEKGLAAAAKLSDEAKFREAASLDKHVLLKKLRDLLESLRGRVAGRNKDDVEEAISMVEALAVQLTHREGELLQEKAEVKKLANFLKQASEDAKKMVEEERAFARAEIESARATVQRIEEAIDEQERMSRSSEKQVMDMEHELKALRIQLREKSMYSLQLRKEIQGHGLEPAPGCGFSISLLLLGHSSEEMIKHMDSILAMSKRLEENKSNLYELDGSETLGSCLRIVPCAESAPDISKCYIQWFRISPEGSKKDSSNACRTGGWSGAVGCGGKKKKKKRWEWDSGCNRRKKRKEIEEEEEGDRGRRRKREEGRRGRRQKKKKKKEGGDMYIRTPAQMYIRTPAPSCSRTHCASATKSSYAPEPYDVGRCLQAEIMANDQKVVVTTTGLIDPVEYIFQGLGSYVEALVRKADTEFNVVVTQMNGHDHASHSIYVFHVGKMRIRLRKGMITKAKEPYSSSMQLCGVRGGGNAAAQALFWQPKKVLSFTLAFESERERNAAIMLARRFAFDCNRDSHLLADARNSGAAETKGPFKIAPTAPNQFFTFKPAPLRSGFDDPTANNKPKGIRPLGLSISFQRPLIVDRGGELKHRRSSYRRSSRVLEPLCLGRIRKERWHLVRQSPNNSSQEVDIWQRKCCVSFCNFLRIRLVFEISRLGFLDFLISLLRLFPLVLSDHVGSTVSIDSAGGGAAALVGKQKPVAGEFNNRRALGDIGNLVNVRGGVDMKPQVQQISRPITRFLAPVSRSFGAQLLAKAQAAADNKPATFVADGAAVGGKAAKAPVADGAAVGGKAAKAAVADGAAAGGKAARAAKQKVTIKPKPEMIIEISPETEEESEAKKPGLQNSRHRSSRKKVESLTSVLTARSKFACGLTKAVLDIDAADSEDQLAVVDYVEDIYKFYKSSEKSTMVHEYMSSHVEINHKMRAILIDWLIDVHHKFELMPETLYLTVHIVDQYLSMKVVLRKELQLVGIGAMLIASKYEEIWAPEVNDFICISDRAYTREQILLMEKRILNRLEWSLTVPTKYVFLLRFLKAAQSDKEMEHMVFFLAELALTQYSMIVYCPSMIAAAAVYVAQCTLKKNPPWNETLKRHTGFSELELVGCAKLLVVCHSAAAGDKLKAVHKKYSSPLRGGVALLPPASKLLLLEDLKETAAA
ncbi:hypothetical protein ACLOJK_000283 [Asimina triloba]